MFMGLFLAAVLSTGVEIPEAGVPTWEGEPEFYCYATHEEYFHKDYFAYQPDYCQKTLVAAKWMHDHGYSYIFIEDSVD